MPSRPLLGTDQAEHWPKDPQTGGSCPERASSAGITLGSGGKPSIPLLRTSRKQSAFIRSAPARAGPSPAGSGCAPSPPLLRASRAS